MSEKAKTRRLTEEQKAKAASAMDYAFLLAYRYVNAKKLRRIESQVLEGAIDGLIQAARGHDPSRGKMTTLVNMACHRRMAKAVDMAIKSERRRATRNISKYNGYHDFWRSVEDHREPGMPGIESQEDAEQLRDTMARCLTDRQQALLSMLFGIGVEAVSAKEAAAILGVTKQAVSNAKNAALRTLRRELEREGVEPAAVRLDSARRG